MLRRLLSLFEVTNGPVLADYDREMPDTADADDEPWSCPLPLPPLEPASSESERQAQALRAEAAFLLPWYNEGLQRKGRTLFGLSGLSVEDLPEMTSFIATFAVDGGASPPPGAREPLPAALRSVVDDLKTFYLEAAAARPGRVPNPAELNRWLYHDTRLGFMLYELRDRLARQAAAQAEPGQPPRPPAVAVIPNAFRDRPRAD